MVSSHAVPGSRRLTTLDATLLVMGGILGVGIFFTPQIVAERTVEPWAFTTMWVVGGVFALAAAMTFAEWAATLPEAGGWYVYLRESLGRLPAFLFAWTILSVVSTGAIATVALFAARSIDNAFQGVAFGEAGRLLCAVLLVTGVTVACLAGVKASALFQNAIMAVKLGAIAVLIVAGWLVFEPQPGTPLPPPVSDPAGASVGGMLSALLPVFYAYGGWQMVCYIAPQVRDPARTLPRAIVLGVVGVIVVYVLLTSSYLRVLGIGRVAADEGFATALGAEVFGETGIVALNAGFALSASGWLVVTVLGTPWLYVVMARERLFFRSFAECSAREAPTRALVLQWAIAVAYLTVAELHFLVDAVVFCEWIFHGLVAWGLLRFRRTRPDAPRPFRSPLYPLAPVLYLVAAVLAVGNKVADSDPSAAALGLGVVALGGLAYAAWTRFDGDRPPPSR